MLLATLGLFQTRTHALFGLKKTGEIGNGLHNAPGGTVEPGETVEMCLVRECYEEVGVKPLIFEEVAILFCYHFTSVLAQRVHVFSVNKWDGDTKDTDYMQPAWWLKNDLPFSSMHEGDERWIERALLRERFIATIRYAGKAKEFLDIAFEPYRSIR